VAGTIKSEAQDVRCPVLSGGAGNGDRAWPALTDIYHQGFAPGRMSDYGEHGEEEAPAARAKP
jgi:hypothetical protein